MRLKLLLIFTCWAINNAEIALTDFFPYGLKNGDTLLSKGDDVSSPRQVLQYPFPFFDVSQPTLWVNENGIISFQNKMSEFTPWCRAVPSQYRMIAPFWADVDARHVGSIFYRQTTEAQVLSQAESDIERSFGQHNIKLKWGFIATWIDVTYFIDFNDTAFDNRKKNSFQVAFATDGTQSFAIFYYNKITWTTGDVSGGTNGMGGTPAEVGYDYGDGVHFDIVSTSCTTGVLNIGNATNMGSPGKFIFKTNAVQTTPTPSPECLGNYTGDFCVIPNTIDIMGHVYIDITHIQLTTTNRALCRYYDSPNVTEANADIVTLTHIRCKTPFFFTTGRLTIEIEIWDAEQLVTSNQTLTGYIYLTQPKDQTLNIEFLANGTTRLTWDPSLIDFSLSKEITADNARVWSMAACTFGLSVVEIGKLSKEDTVEGLKKTLKGGIKDYTSDELLHLPCSADPLQYECASFFYIGEWDGEDIEIVYDLISKRPIFNALPFINAAFLKNVCPGYAETCRKYLLGQTRSETPVLSVPADLPPCPPTLELAQLDPNFVVDPYCSFGASCDLNPGADVCYDSATPSAGIPYMFHPSINAGYPHKQYDWKHLMCCQIYPQYCSDDPSPSTGQNYTPPVPTLGNGDPHFTTFDGLFYTFNGAGEFWLIKDNPEQPIAVQTRFGLPGGLSSGWTYFAAYALKSANSSVVQVDSNPYAESFTVYYNGIAVPPEIITQQFNADDVAIWGSGQSIFITFTGGLSFHFENWSLRCYASEDLRGNFTHGILGTFDGNPFNDLLTPYGVLVPANSTTEVIHYKFGLEWMVKQEESLFNYF